MKLDHLQGETKHQLKLFILVGCLNTLVGYSLYALFILWNMDYVVAVLLSTVLGVLFNFKTTGKIVFRKNGLFFKFLAVYGVAYFLNIILIKLIYLIVNNLYLAGFLTLIPIALLTFILNKLFVFKDAYETH